MKNSILNCGLVMGVTFLMACGDSKVTPGTKVLNYLDCAAVPAGTVTTHSCPGASGTWNAYAIVKNSSGVVTSIDQYCGGGDGEHYSGQADFNTAVTTAGGGYVSNNDYVSTSSCASASKTKAGVDTQMSVWQKTL